MGLLNGGGGSRTHKPLTYEVIALPLSYTALYSAARSNTAREGTPKMVCRSKTRRPAGCYSAGLLPNVLFALSANNRKISTRGEGHHLYLLLHSEVHA